MTKEDIVNIMLEFERNSGEYKCGVQFMRNLLDKLIDEGVVIEPVSVEK